MAAASLTVSSEFKNEIRKYGGNNSDVKSMFAKYNKMTETEFLSQHPCCNVFDYISMKLVTRFHKS